MSDIFFRWKYEEISYAGWYYKYKNEVSKIYKLKIDAENALTIRIMETKPQRGRSTIKTATGI